MNRRENRRRINNRLLLLFLLSFLFVSLSNGLGQFDGGERGMGSVRIGVSGS
jgi:hypothetical protein